MADDAGALLVRSGLVSSSALDDARLKVADGGGTVGEQLVVSGILADDVLTDFYKSRLLVPQVNPNTLARLPAAVVGMIPGDMAIELRAIPVSLDKDNNLTVAMSDPSDRHAVDEIAFFTGTYVVRAVATQMQIAWCLAHYYGHVTSLGQRLLQPNNDAPPERVAAAIKTPRQRGITGQVEAMRRKAIVPVAPVEPAPAAHDTEEMPVPEVLSPDSAKTPRARSISGEIRVVRRAPSIRPPLPDDESGPIITMEVDGDHSAPVITIEQGESHDDDTARTRPAPKRRRPAEPDPPELAARAGEVSLKAGPDRAVGDGPSIVIDDDLDREAAPEVVSEVATSRSKTSPLLNIHVSGEVVVRDRGVGPAEPNSNISIAVEPADADTQLSGPVVIHERPPSAESAAPVKVEDLASQPILLDRKRDSDAPPAPEVGDDVVVLDTKKLRPPTVDETKARTRTDKRTEVGLGAIGGPRPHRDTETGGGPDLAPEDEDPPTGPQRILDVDPTRVDTHAAPPREDTSSDEILAAPPSPVHDDDTSPVPAPSSSTKPPPPSGHIALSGVKPATRSPDDDDDDGDDNTDVVRRGNPTMVMTAVELDEVIPDRSSEVVPAHLDKRHVDYDPVDEGWGPPGTTIPPPLLGAIPGAVEPSSSGVIPISNLDSQPLMVAPALAPEISRPSGPRIDPSTETGLTRALERATSRVLELIRSLEHATERDQVVAVMIAHLGETHRRAGFLATRAGELSLFSIRPKLDVLPPDALRLDRPSTLQDVVGTRLPYRGPMHDDTSRTFLTAVLGACPPEILLVPITVRERVVGVLFGEHRMRHTFDDQLALAGRAAGAALERILKAKR